MESNKRELVCTTVPFQNSSDLYQKENTNQVEAEKGSPAFKSSGGKKK